MKYGTTLSLYMKEKGLSQKRLSELSGVGRMTINRLLSGQSKEPTLGNAEKLAEALGVTIDDFVIRMHELDEEARS